MATFNAGEVVESLDWTFKPFVDAHGKIREPSDQAISDFLEDMKRLYSGAAKMDAKATAVMKALGPDADPEKVAEAVEALPTQSLLSVMADMSEAYSKLCGGHPTKTQILKLPLRARVAFFAWLQNEVVNPEAVSGGGTAQVIALPAAAGGSSST